MFPTHPIIAAKQEEAGTRQGSGWLSAGILVVLLLPPAAAALWSMYTTSRADLPSDNQLTSNFYAHEASFEDLVRMFSTDRVTLSTSRHETVSLASLEELVGPVRSGQYFEILKKISVSDLRYDFLSGDLTLLPQGTRGEIDAASKVYRYMPQGEPEPLAQHHSYYFRGPGIYFVTGDRLLEKHWFIHHNAGVHTAYSPY